MKRLLTSVFSAILLFTHISEAKILLATNRNLVNPSPNVLNPTSVEVFELSFSANGAKHHGLMLLRNGGTGLIRIQFYSERNHRQETVEQIIESKTTNRGALMLACYRPVYAGSMVRHPAYKADNFILWKDNANQYHLTNVDDGNQVADTYFRLVESTDEQKQLLRQFGWKDRAVAQQRTDLYLTDSL